MNKKINLKELANSIVEQYLNTKIESINNHCLRLAVNTDKTYPWHRHNKTDELFIVLEGKLRIEFEKEHPVELLPNEAFCVTSGTIHRTTAIGRTVNLCFETDHEDTEFIEP